MVNKNFGSNDRSGKEENGYCDEKPNNSDAKLNQLLDLSLRVGVVAVGLYSNNDSQMGWFF
ncbi:unnamed protein product [Lupinus luteus]|uniref:CASP-like protein n=1 Tax=Lupinus luteus TaxID=3873 RepID=A0AAV1W380_LUPLU